MSQENIETARRLYDAWNRDDLAAVWELCDPALVIDRSESLLNTRIYRGREEVEQFWKDFRESWEEPRWEIDEYIDAGGSVVVLGRVYGRGPASGADVAANVSQLLTFRQGKIARAKLFQNKSDALAAAELSQ